MSMKIFASVAFVVVAFNWVQVKGECPACPENSLPCHNQFLIGYPEDCMCQICLTNCDTRNSPCEAGFECAYEEVKYNEEAVGESAVCRPFQECPQIECPEQCTESGYFVDKNGCTTCLCNDPCKELKCPDDQCMAWSINPGTEENVSCA